MTAFEATPYDLPLKVVYRWAKGEHTSRAGIILRCRLKDGAEGWGEVAFGPHVEIDGAKMAQELMDIVRDLDPESGDFLERVDSREPHNRMRCAIATAWFSAQAASAGQPLNRYLAGANRDIPPMQVPVNGLVGERDVAAAIAQAAGYARQGMTTLKIKCFADVAHDLERVRALREAFSDFTFRLDPNDAWKTLHDALRNMESFAPFGIDYVEDPIDTGTVSIGEMAEICRSGAILTAWDNPVETLENMRRLVEAEAVNVFIFKMPRAGGPDRFLEMADFAAASGIRCVNTGPLETAIGTLAGLHVASLLPQPISHAAYSLSGHYARAVAVVPPVVCGIRSLPDIPGLGISPNVG